MPILTVNERGGFTHVINVSFTELQAIGTGLSRTIFTLPAGAAVELVGIVKTTQVVGSTSLVLDVGYTGVPLAFISGLDADASTVGLPTYNTGTDFVQSVATTTFKGGSLPVRAVSAATAVTLRVTDAALASITAGSFVIAIRVLDISRFA